MIRLATIADIPVMLRMGRDFVRTGVNVPFDAAYADASLRGHLAAPERLSLVLELQGRVRGMLCAGLMESPLAPVRLAQELVFWIDPDARGRWAVALMRDYEDWARRAGCRAVSLVARPGCPTDRLYHRRGYVLTETTYTKDF